MPNYEFKDILKILFLHIITLLNSKSLTILLKNNIKNKAYKIFIFK